MIYQQLNISNNNGTYWWILKYIFSSFLLVNLQIHIYLLALKELNVIVNIKTYILEKCCHLQIRTYGLLKNKLIFSQSGLLALERQFLLSLTYIL